MVQPHQLQIDLHVTRDDGVRKLLSTSTSVNHFKESTSTFAYDNSDPYSPPLPLPIPSFAGRPQRGRTDSADSFSSENESEAVDNSRRTAALYAELDDTFNSPADLALFEGEEDEPTTTADQELSNRIRKAGLENRRQSRQSHYKTQLDEKAVERSMKDETNLMDSSPSKAAFLFPPSSATPPRSSSHQYPPRSQSLIKSTSHSPVRPQLSHSYSTDDFSRPFNNDSTAFLHHSSSSGNLYQSQYSDIERSGGMRDEENNVALDVTEQDEDDLDAVAILARTGHPDLDKVLDDEIDRAEGKIIVACTFLFGNYFGTGELHH